MRQVERARGTWRKVDREGLSNKIKPEEEGESHVATRKESIPATQTAGAEIPGAGCSCPA